MLYLIFFRIKHDYTKYIMNDNWFHNSLRVKTTVFKLKVDTFFKNK